MTKQLFDYQTPLLNLPFLFKTLINTIPLNQSYLKVQEKIIDWKEAHPTPSKPPTIGELDAFEKAKAKSKKESDDESEEDKHLSKYVKLKKKGVI